MKCQIPQISWHGRDPVLSIDFQPIKSDQYRLASGGTDSHVLIWYVTYQENKTVKVECASDLYRHNKSVNVVRFSPNGEYLTSGDDEGAMFVWQLKEREQVEMPKEDENVNKEEWYPVKLLRGHLEDIYDISWSKDGNFLVSASMDNTAIIWDMQKFVKIHMLSDFKGYVQGVSWDPCNQFIASLGSDRTLRIHNISSKKAVCRLSKAPWSNSTEKGTFKAKLFYDDTLKSYCRRLTYTPDGELLIVPSGIIEKNEKLNNTCYIFSRHVPNKPVITLPTGDWYTIAVRCNPFLYKLRKEEAQTEASNKENAQTEASNKENAQNEASNKENEQSKTMINLPYRMIFAVAACDSVLMYDTEQLLPFACISNIHYTHLTDLAWSPDGLTLVASSTDGYCSFIVFTREELGEIYVPEEPPESDKICESLQTTAADTNAVLETPNDKTPLASVSINIKSPKDVPVANNTDVCETPKSSIAVDKKSEKRSPKMASIKKFFVSPKTVVSTPRSAKSNKTAIEMAVEGGSSGKVEPEVITLCDTPEKVGLPLESTESKTNASTMPSGSSVTVNVEAMDVDENLPGDADISEEKPSISEKPAKCKVRLDFSGDAKAESDDTKENVKKSPKMSIKKFFMSSKATTAAKPSRVINKTGKETSTTLNSSEIIVVSGSSLKVEKSAKSCKNNIAVPSSSKVNVSSIVKDNLMDVDKNMTSEIEISFTKKNKSLVVSKSANETKHNDAKNANKNEPVLNIDENASDGDNSIPVSDLKTREAEAENENDWKLELSQDEDIVPMEVVQIDTKPSESKQTPKRRVAFVTLSSKATVNK